MSAPTTGTALTPSDTARLAAGVIEEIEKVVVGRRRALELVLLGVRPVYASLHGQPRFAAVRASVGV